MFGRESAGIAAIMALAAGATLGQEQTFNVYGFADAGFDKADIAKNNFLNFYVPSDLIMGLRHFNVYSDWRPSAQTRALLEMGFVNDQEVGVGTGFPNRRIIQNIAGWSQFIGSIAPFMTPAQLAQLAPVKEHSDTTIVMGQKFAEFNLPVIERAYFDVAFNAYFNLRFGRFITPAGIWNVDHGSPVILTIKQPYQTAVVPIFPKSQDGLVVFGSGYFGDHDYDYQLYLSTGNGGKANNLKDPTYLSGGGHATVRLDFPVKIKAGLSGFSGVVRRTEITNQAVRNFTYTDFTTANAALGGAQLPDPTKLQRLGQIGDDEYYLQTVTKIQDRQLAFGLDLRVDYQGIFAQSEYNHRLNKNELKNDKESIFEGYYLIVGYKFPAKEWLSVTPYAMYEGLGWEDVQNSGSEGTFGYLPMEGFDSYIGGVNIGLYGNVYVKLEYNFSTIRKLDAPPAFPTFVNQYEDGDLDITTFSGQFAIAF